MIKGKIKEILIKILSVEKFIQFQILFNKVLMRKSCTIDLNAVFEILSKKSNVNFIQIGANDGKTNDPIFHFIGKYKWLGVLVEPIPDIFERLKASYKNCTEHLIFENCGVGEFNEAMDFYSLPIEFDDPNWLQQIGSFNLDAFKRNLEVLPGFIDKMITTKLPVITWDELVSRSDFNSLDLLVVDVEGAEYVVIKQLAESKIKPNYLLFEWGSMSAADFEKTKTILISLSYDLYITGGDVFCIRKK
jgi:FkbM family methyltransferase